MKLFTFSTSPYARKVRMMLEYKGLECEMAERCYSLDRKPDLRDASERAEVPVLVLNDGRTIADFAAICHLPVAHAMRLSMNEFPRVAAWEKRMRAIPLVAADLERARKAMAEADLADEFEGPDGRVHWRDSRLEWPVRHGFVDF